MDAYNYGPRALTIHEVVEIVAQSIDATVDLDPFDRDVLADAVTAALVARDLLAETPTK